MATKKKPAAKKAPARKAAPAREMAGQNKASAEHRRALFIEAYLSNNENATQAALAAGFSPKSAASQASRLLKNVKVQQELDSRRTQVLEKVGLSTERVLQSLAQALFFDPRKLYRDDGGLKDVWELDEDTAMALSALEVTEEKGTGDERGKVVGYTKKLKWLDKNTARDQAMKHFGQYLKDNKQGGEAAANALTALLGTMRRSALPVVAKPLDD